MKNRFNQKGQLLILALIVLTLILVNSVIIIGNALTVSRSSRYSASEIQAINLAESGLDKAVEALNKTAGGYNGEAETSIGQGSYSVTITSVDANTKKVVATGYLPNKANPTVTRTVEAQILKASGVSFSYGVQTGQGGLQMSNNARIIGSTYANGNITMSNGSQITGDAYVAGGTQPMADQESECTNPNCLDFEFGRTTNGQLDIAQSFRPANTAVINKVALKLKKVGSPPNLTVRILGNSGSNPNKNQVLASGTLAANLVTNQYGFAEIAFTSPPTLTANTTYWIVIDTSANSSNYWHWSNDSAQGYTRGNAKWSPNWQAGSPVWNNISGDLGFKTYMGGVATSITGANNAIIGGNAKANTLTNLTVTGGAYYQTSTNVTAGSYHPGSPDPAPQTMPISDANITEWKNAATSKGVFTGNISGCPGTLAAGKYVGNVNLTNGCVINMADPIWITGNLSLSNNAEIRLNSSYGANSGILVVDGTINLSNNGKLKGSGTAGSFLTGLSTYDSRSNGVVAINSDNGSTSTILYAGNGIIHLSNNAQLVEVTGWRLEMDNGSTVTYNQGLANLNFTSGPSGEFAVVKGSYKIK